VRLRLALLLVAATLGPSSSVAAADGSSAASTGWSRELERELMSPYCPGRSLIECPSPAATELRLWIQGQEKAGVSRAAVEQRLFEEFGDQLRQSPRPEGWGLVAYLVPAGVLLVGGTFAFGFLRRQSRTVSGAPVPTDPDLVREIDRELDAS
jgi:cytochrome c-type biogenesis protein CcmH/NrfF